MSFQEDVPSFKYQMRAAWSCGPRKTILVAEMYSGTIAKSCFNRVFVLIIAVGLVNI